MQMYMKGYNTPSSVVFLASSLVDGVLTLNTTDFVDEIPSAGYTFVAVHPEGSVSRTVVRCT